MIIIPAMFYVIIGKEYLKILVSEIIFFHNNFSKKCFFFFTITNLNSTHQTVGKKICDSRLIVFLSPPSLLDFLFCCCG